MAKDISVSLPNSNLYLVASGLDINGNKVVKLSFPNERAFSIQTNSGLPKTGQILRGLKTPKDMLSVSKSDLVILEKECVAYIKSYGSALQKKKLRTYVRSSDIKCTFCGHKAIYETLTNNNYLCDDNDCKLQYVDEIIRELK